MRTRIVIAGLAVLALAAPGCTTGGSAKGGTLTGVTWALQTYRVDGTNTTVPASVFVDATFQETPTAVSGSAGCNRYTGTYTVTGSDLSFGPMAVTQMACIGPAGDVESAYLASLATVATYTVTEATLTMHDSGGAEILAYAAVQPGALAGVTWHATGINNGQQAVVSVAAGSDPTAIYDEAGTVSGNSGCNEYNGPAVVEGDAVRIGPLVSTRRACADPAVNDQETAFLNALQAATTFEARAGKLELRDADGALQVSFEQR
jgi:heat shock protein HslJ